jgi:uncharacterized membrane protein
MTLIKAPVKDSLPWRNLSPEMRSPLLLAIGFFLVTLLLGLNRHLSFFSSYDQGIFNQVFWNNLHGHWFESSLSSVLSTNVVHGGQVPDVVYRRLGQHFTPALLLWLPFYALAPSATTLVLLQVGLITAGGIVLYALARHYLSAQLSLLIMAGYYGANAVIGPVFSNFHDLCQIPLFIFSLLLALEKRIWWLVWLMAGLTLLVRQDAGVGLFGVGVYLVVSRRFPRTGLALCTLSFTYVVVVTSLIMPLFSDDISRRFMMERFGQYATGDRATPLQILWDMVSQPGRVIASLLREPIVKVLYVLVQTLPLAFVPFLTPYAWAIAGFPLLQIFLQQGDTPVSIHIRYAITVVPGLFYGAILWWSTHEERLKRGFKRFWIACIAISILIAIPYNPHQVFFFAIPSSVKPWVYVSLPRQWEHTHHIRSLAQQIPPTASVSATTYLVPHLSKRREVLRFPFLQFRDDQRQVANVDYVFLDLFQLERYRSAFPLERVHFQFALPMIDTFLNQKTYGIVGLEDGVILLQRNATSSPEFLQRWAELRQEYTRRSGEKAPAGG